MTNNKKVNFKVNGIHCGGCANKIKTAIANLNIEQNVEVNVETGNVNVEFNSNESSIAKLKEAITSVGFEVESIELA